MECETSDNKKLFKVFDASKRKRCRKKREGLNNSINSQGTGESNSVERTNIHSVKSDKAILLDSAQGDAPPGTRTPKRDRESRSASPAPVKEVHHQHSRRHRRLQREEMSSLALKAGQVSTPRSTSPQQEEIVLNDSVPGDQDSMIYAFLEEAIKKDRRKRLSRRHDERRSSHDRNQSEAREHRHHHHHRKRRDSHHREKDSSPTKQLDQALLMETFAKMCVHMNGNRNTHENTPKADVARAQSHKSLQCEVMDGRREYEMDQRPVKLRSHNPSRENIPASRTRSHDNIQHESRTKIRSPCRSPSVYDRKDMYLDNSYERGPTKLRSKLDVGMSRLRVADDRYRQCPPHTASRHEFEHRYRSELHERDRERDYDDRRPLPPRDRKHYDDKRLYCEQKTSRSYDLHRDLLYEDKFRRTSRSDAQRRTCDDFRELRDPRDRCYEEQRELRDLREKRFEGHKDKYYEEKYDRDVRSRHFSNLPSRDRRSRRNLDRLERASVVSREDDYNRERDRYSERERDSGLSVADGDTSTLSGRSNYLKVVKQEIAEQRDAMDKMMKLWKELMRCFKGISQNQGQPEKEVQDSAASMQESAAAQLRLWRECMRRYETVARDVGDTDARLMEEINKQRSEMAEMANMWQECLQRYRDMSSDFNNLKQKLATSESPSRMTQPPLVSAEGESSGLPLPAPYRMPPNYPPPPMAPVSQQQMPLGEYCAGGSPLRPRQSMPPAWWWCENNAAPPRRRRSSPESRGSRHGSRSRERRHRRKDSRDEPRFKEKPSKPNAARSEHRHRKR